MGRSLKVLLIIAIVLGLSGAMIVSAASSEETTSSATGSKTSASQPKVAVKHVKVGSKTYPVQTVTLPKNIGVGVGLANRKVGDTASLTEIAKQYNASYAINGTFFEAYGGIPEPYGMLIANGQLAHVGNTGTTIGFTKDGHARMDALRVSVTGSVYDEDTGRTNSWYVYFVNRTPVKGKNGAILYTPQRGKTIGFNYGHMIVVNQGVVTQVTQNKNVEIPTKGYVLVFNGTDSGQAGRFKVGDQVSYNVSYKDLNGKTLPWNDVVTAVGAGPRLVKDGRVAVNPAAEGFVSSKILTSGGARSGIAIMKDGSIMLTTVGNATIPDWASIMVKLGAQQAMNLDGGASSGLYANGKIVTAPGRKLSNALIFGNQIK